MSMNKRYTGGFISIEGVHYTFDILQEGYSGGVSDIAVTADPLHIDWDETDKLEPVQSSAATLELYSDSDRQFVDLYTVKAGSIRLDVFREGALYWSGTLDPELYEEPFAYKTDYGVKLTFSDFAILDRLNWTDKGFKTIYEIITTALTVSGIASTNIVQYVSTKVDANSRGPATDNTAVQCLNFFDEDGEPMTIREVLDETLRPFALRLIQKAGKVILYDLNGISNGFKNVLKWDSDDAVFSIDKVYNSVKVTFSTYEKTKLIEGKVDPETVTGEPHTTYVQANAVSRDEVGFNTYLSDSGKGLEKNSLAKYYRTEPVFSGEESAGVAWTFQNFGGRNWGQWVSHIQKPTQNTGGMLLRAPKSSYISLSPAGTWSNRYYLLKVSVALLFDPRYNPFEEASENNEEGAWNDQQNRANFAYVPIKLTLRDEAGTALCHWHNDGIRMSDGYIQSNQSAKWVPGEAQWGNAWLCWYNGDRKKESGLGGWQENKQLIGYYRGKLPTRYEKMGKGEFIHLPDDGGFLELEIGTGIVIWDYDKAVKQSVYDNCRFMFFKDPKVELVDGNGKTVNGKDISISAWLNRDAKEPLDIDTLLGTMPDPSPVALGQLYDAATRNVRATFYRAGVTDSLEKLLIATVYSNYSGRNVILSGTTELLPDFGIYTDTNEPGAYVLLQESQDLLNDESEIKMVQFEADSFEGIEYKG